MESQDTLIRQAALARVAYVFGVPVAALNAQSRFGHELRASFVSHFRDNELDQILADIQEMKEDAAKKGLSDAEVHTVGEFCARVEQFHLVSPAGCQGLVGRWAKVQQMQHRWRWRRMIYHLIGV